MMALLLKEHYQAQEVSNILMVRFYELKKQFFISQYLMQAIYTKVWAVTVFIE